MMGGALPDRRGGDDKTPSDDHFLRKVLTVALVAVLLLVLWQVSRVVILTIAAILVAIALHALSAPLQKYARLPAPVALGIATLGFCGAVIGLVDLFGILAIQQFGGLYQRLPEAWREIQGALQGSSFGRIVLAQLPATFDRLGRMVEALPLAGGILGALGECVLIIAVGIYFAADHKTYVEGILHLVPRRRRARMREILLGMGVALRQWLVGMSVDMLLLGTMVFFGLWAIGMPLVFALAVLAGVGVFIPYIGPAMSVIPGIMVALSISPRMALWAGLVYLVALTIEGNLSQPLLQRWAVSIPPALNMLAILVFSPLFGLWGAVLATPLLVGLWVLVKMAYVEDVLKDRPPIAAPSEHPPG